MRKKENPLNLQVNSFWRIFFKIIFMMIYLLFLVASISIMIDGGISSVAERDIVIDTILFTLFAVFRVFNKNACRAMKAVRGYMTYEEVEKYLEHEEFKKIDGCIIKMEVSDNWIKLDGTFIPKNFVSAIYIQHDTRFKFLHLLLINGRGFADILCSGSGDPQKQMDIIVRLLPNASYVLGSRYSLERKILKENFKAALESGKTVDMCIKQWDNDFDFKNFNKYEKNFK